MYTQGVAQYMLSDVLRNSGAGTLCTHLMCTWIQGRIRMLHRLDMNESLSEVHRSHCGNYWLKYETNTNFISNFKTELLFNSEQFRFGRSGCQLSLKPGKERHFIHVEYQSYHSLRCWVFHSTGGVVDGYKMGIVTCTYLLLSTPVRLKSLSVGGLKWMKLQS